MAADVANSPDGSMPTGIIDVKTLEELADAGRDRHRAVHVPRHAGTLRRQAHRAGYFLNEVLGATGLHACEYLLTVDIQTEVTPGYKFASWQTGYGDFTMVPDLATLRICPWIEKTAMVLCDLEDEETGKPIAVAPRSILKRQLDRARKAGFTANMASELEFYLFNRLVSRARRCRVSRAAALVDLHDRLPHAADDEGRAGHPQDPQRHAGRRHPGGVLQGRDGVRPARDQHHLCRSPRGGRQPLHLQARLPRDRRRRRHGHHLHGEVVDGAGRLVLPHPLEPLERRRQRLDDVGRGPALPHVQDLPALPGRAAGHGTRAAAGCSPRW